MDEARAKETGTAGDEDWGAGGGHEHGSGLENIVAVESAYELTDYSRAFARGYERHFWHQARLRIVAGQLASLDATGTVMDVGCGPGAYVKALGHLGYDCVGCDPGDVPADAALAGRLFGRTELDAVPPDIRARVDVALMLDVLEHAADPVALLARVVEALPRLRAVVITVPARQELWSELDRRAGHQQRFSIDGLRAVVEQAGCVASDVRYLFRLLYPFAWLSRHRARSVTPPARATLHALAGRLLAAEARMLPRGVPGTSVLCIARPMRAKTRPLSR